MFVDHYEVLQISPNADTETVRRIYRIQAQRFHPDNGETGNDQEFRRVAEAYRVLSDSALRAAYDQEHAQAQRRTARNLFEQDSSSEGIDVERQQRQEILNLLYARRRAQPDQPGMSLRELEDILAIPRKQLDFSLWFLKEGGFLNRTDSARHTITMKGVECVESTRQAAGVPQPKPAGTGKMLA